MDTAASPNFRGDIHQRRAAIAHQWYLALSSGGSFQLDRTEALRKFSLLTDRVIAFLRAESPLGTAAQEIGMDLASLPCIDPLALEKTGELWAGQLAWSVFPAGPAGLYPRMLVLLNGMATGFARRAREIVLDEQEDIRSAMAADLLATTYELKKYQSHLEAMLTDRTRELREREEQFRAIAETSIDGVFQSADDTDAGGLIYVNNAFAKMLGYRPDELLGRSTISLIAEAELPKLPPIAQDVRVNQPVDGEFRLRHKDGHLVDIHFSVVPTELNGRIVRSGILQDITERKRVQAALFQSEERYRTLAEASPDMIYIIGEDDRIKYINSFAATFLGLPPEEIIGELREHFFPTPIYDHQKINLLKILKDGKTTYGEDEVKIYHRTAWLGTWLVPLRDVWGNISGVMGVSRDITKQKHAELEILRSRDDLEMRVKERTADLITSQSQLRKLTDQLVTALEEERRRISRELHDEAGQALITLKYSLASLQSDIPESNLLARRNLVDSMQIIDQVMRQIRTLTHSLRPPVLEFVGINLSLKEYCEEFTKRTGLAIRYQGEDIPGLPDEIGIGLYRFVQEALTNIVKHARATRVEVRFKYMKKQIILKVSDNGRGMEGTPRTDGIGLIGIQERLNLFGGSLQIRSRTKQGVHIIACVPWPRPVDKIETGESLVQSG